MQISNIQRTSKGLSTKVFPQRAFHKGLSTKVFPHGLSPVTGPNVLALSRNRAMVLAELRRLMPGIEGRRTPLPLGLAAIDSHLPDGGLARGALHEIVPAADCSIAAAFGFIAAILGRIFLPPPAGGRMASEARPVGVSAHTDPSPALRA